MITFWCSSYNSYAFQGFQMKSVTAWSCRVKGGEFKKKKKKEKAATFNFNFLERNGHDTLCSVLNLFKVFSLISLLLAALLSDYAGRLHLRKEWVSGSFQGAAFVPIIVQIIFKEITQEPQEYLSRYLPVLLSRSCMHFQRKKKCATK